MVAIVLLIAPVLLGPLVATALSLIPRRPPPGDIPWWVLCATPHGTEGPYERAYVVDWRPVAQGAQDVTPFGLDAALLVQELDPIGDAAQHARAAEAVAALEVWLADGAWRAGPAGLTVSYRCPRTSLLFWLDDHGIYRSVYHVLDSGEVTDIGVAFSPSAFGLTRESPLLQGCWYGLLFSEGLVALCGLFVALSRLLLPTLRRGAP